MRQKKTSEKGFTLVEMMIVLIIISLLSAIYVTRVYNKNSDAGGGERIITDAVTALKSRRNEAIRLSGNDHRQDLSVQHPQPLEIDFGNLASTASLRIDGDDVNGDCQDDFTGNNLTCLEKQSGGDWNWNYVYLDDAMKLPQNWTVLQAARQLGGAPLIFDGASGRGVLTTKIGFTPDGKAKAFNSKTGTWDSYPEGSAGSDHPSLEESPFWAIYFGEGGSMLREQKKALIAIAVHPSGLIERYRYDLESGWIGYDNR